MTAPDRTEELIRAMLERRSGRSAPTWLGDRTMHAVTTVRQVERGWRGRLTMPAGTGPRIALATAGMAAVLLIAVGALVAGGVIDLPGMPPASAPVVIVDPSAGPTSTAPGTAGPTASMPPLSPAPRPTPRPVAETLAPDSLAVVTEVGFDLRVRSAPGVGSDSRLLEPLLQTGTRLLVVSGPVAASGYDWYEVLVDPARAHLYGWVAAAGKDGAAWIRPTAPACPETLDETTLAAVSRLDYLVCYGSAEVEVIASRVEPMPSDDTPCLSIGIDVCTVEPAWMNAAIWLGLDVGDGETVGLRAVASPDVYELAEAVPEGAPALVLLAADQPEARACRFVDSTGRDLAPPERAALACRMEFVILDLAWDEPEDPGTEPADDLAEDTLAAVNVGGVEAWSAPSEEPGARSLYALNRDMLVYVDAGPFEGDEGTWYGILPEDPQVGPYGWVLVSYDDEPALVPAPIDCPSPRDWARFNELSTVRRLVCASDEPVVVDVVIRAQPEPQPTSSFACMARAGTVDPGPCLATPQWLSSPTGIDVTAPGAISYPAVDPSAMAQSTLPSTPTLMRVIGRYEHPDAAECRVTNVATGDELMDPAEAAIYCRARFVILAAAPIP